MAACEPLVAPDTTSTNAVAVPRQPAGRTAPWKLEVQPVHGAIFGLVAISLIVGGCFITGISATHLVSATPKMLLHPDQVALTHLANSWELARCGLFPLCASVAFWIFMCHGTDGILKRVDARLKATGGLDSPDAHAELVKEAGKWPLADVVAAVLHSLGTTLIWSGDMTWGLQDTGLALWEYAILSSVGMSLGGIVSARAMRVGLLRAEGPAMKSYLEQKLRPRVNFLMVVAALSMGFAFVMVVNSAPITITVRPCNSEPCDWHEACDLARNDTCPQRDSNSQSPDPRARARRLTARISRQVRRPVLCEGHGREELPMDHL